MTNSFSRRVFLTGGAVALAGAARAAAPDVSLRPRARPAGLARATTAGAEALISQARLGGQVSFSVVSAETGRILEQHEAEAMQPPASVTKAITALYALDMLGAAYRFETRLLATGPVRDGILYGDLVLAGGGDPTLDTDALADLAARLKAAGIHEVRGKFRIYSGVLPFVRMLDDTQPEHVGYNPAISGLNLNFNRVHFGWARNGDGYDVTMDARTVKYRPEVAVARMSVVGRKSPVYTYADGGDHDEWTVASGALGNGGSRWLPVRKPGAYAGEVFAAFVRSNGIALDMAAPLQKLPGGSVLASHRSDPLRDILRDMLRYSNNLTAEVVGMSATAARNGGVQSLRGSAQAMTDWAGERLGVRHARLVDHSGLGLGSRLGAGGMARALARASEVGDLRPILRRFDLRDSQGRVDSAHPIEVEAKTGTLYFVSALAGYMTAPDGTELAFSILTANTDLRGGIDSRSDTRPPGARSWNRRSKQLQQKLIERWGTVYGS